MLGRGERDLASPQMWGAHLLLSSCPLLLMAEKSCVLQTGHMLVARSVGSGLGVVPAQVSWGHASHLLSHLAHIQSVKAASLLSASLPPQEQPETPAPAPPASWAAPAGPSSLR